MKKPYTQPGIAGKYAPAQSYTWSQYRASFPFLPVSVVYGQTASTYVNPRLSRTCLGNTLSLQVEKSRRPSATGQNDEISLPFCAIYCLDSSASFTVFRQKKLFKGARCAECAFHSKTGEFRSNGFESIPRCYPACILDPDSFPSLSLAHVHCLWSPL